MTPSEEELRLRTGLMSAIAYLQHFKGDAECKVVSFPDSIQTAIDDIQSVLDGGNAGDVYRRVLARGWKIVPEDATPDMIDAVMHVPQEHGSTLRDNAESVWKAMISNAPESPDAL